MGSVSVSSYRCCMFVYCVHHVAAFCMTCSLIEKFDQFGILPCILFLSLSFMCTIRTSVEMLHNPVILRV